MLKIYGEPDSPQEMPCLRYKFELANNIHTRDRMSGPSITLKLLNLELSNSQTFELETRWTFELSSRRVSIPNSTDLKPSAATLDQCLPR